MILADTSVWIEHFRAGNRHMHERLEAQEVLMHPFVLGELACGNMPNRASVLAELQKLPHSRVSRDDEALFFIERYSLIGKGLGFIDVHLLASVAITDGSRLWSRDRRLDGIANELDLAYTKD